MARRDKRQRQTFPGPNPGDNQQMLYDIRTTLDSQNSTKAQATSTASTVSDREWSVPAQGSHTSIDRDMRDRERPESADKEQSRRSPPSDRDQALTASASPGTTPRMQQNRSTPTKQLVSHGTKEKLREIKKSLRPFAYSDPGFHAAKDKVSKTMLKELIGQGYNEVRMYVLLCVGVMPEMFVVISKVSTTFRL